MYVKPMSNERAYEWDPVKRAANIEKHGVDFTAADRFDWATAEVIRDARQDEVRYNAFGGIDGRLYVLTFTLRGNAIRIISLRKANRREVRKHG